LRCTVSKTSKFKFFVPTSFPVKNVDPTTMMMMMMMMIIIIIYYCGGTTIGPTIQNTKKQTIHPIIHYQHNTYKTYNNTSHLVYLLK